SFDLDDARSGATRAQLLHRVSRNPSYPSTCAKSIPWVRRLRASESRGRLSAGVTLPKAALPDPAGVEAIACRMPNSSEASTAASCFRTKQAGAALVLQGRSGAVEFRGVEAFLGSPCRPPASRLNCLPDVVARCGRLVSEWSPG